MKINKIHLKNHPFFGTMDIDFESSAGGKTLDTILIGGINGSGKTKLLNAIVEMMSDNKNPSNESSLDIELTEFHEARFIEAQFNGAVGDKKKSFELRFKDIDERLRPKIVYMPTEINFSRFEILTTPYIYQYQFLNVINESVTKDIPNFFATFIDRFVYGKNLLPDQSIALACSEINAIFKELDIESRIAGLRKDGSRMPVFKNKAGKEFDITGLSSGERQLFFRIISLKMLDINNSIILVDEPEISLHPAWQQKIIKVYQNIGENNQVIAATHSPHVLSSVPGECVRILINDNGIKVLDDKDLENSYGVPIKRVLKDIMGLKSDRDPFIQAEIDDLGHYLEDQNYQPQEFERRFKGLEDKLGATDEDMISLKIGKLRRDRKDSHAKNI